MNKTAFELVAHPSFATLIEEEKKKIIKLLIDLRMCNSLWNQSRLVNVDSLGFLATISFLSN
jgi:hypothetical protein